MIHLKTLRAVCILIALLAVFAVRTARATIPTSAALQCGQWNVVASPPILQGQSQLNAVAAVSANDVWAVGDGGNLGQTLVEQWNGSIWQIVASPNAGVYNSLSGVAVVSAQDIWAVGFFGSTSGADLTLIEHWDGSAWSVIPSPNHANSQNDILTSVSAVSASDIWAVGYYGRASFTLQHTLTEHWDGSAWSIVASPNVIATTTELYGVTAVATNDMWAVGHDSLGNYHAVIEHWDGTSWRIASHPHLNAQLYAVTAVSASDAWAVGGSVGAQTFTDHWNGSSWQIVQSPTPHGINFLDGIAANGANDLWSVGWDEVGLIHKSDTEHWDGTKWKLVASPNPGGDSLLFADAMTSSTQVWAVGTYAVNQNKSIFDPLIEYYC